MGQPCGMFLAALLLGQIGARTAKSAKVLEAVINRTPADRPPSLFLLACCANSKFLKARPCGKMEIDRALTLAAVITHLKQFKDRAAEQLADLHT